MKRNYENIIKTLHLFETPFGENLPDEFVDGINIKEKLIEGRRTRSEVVYSLAFPILLKESQNNPKLLMKELGFCYEFGLGTQRSFDKALDCYLKGAEAGDTSCYRKIGMLYRYYPDKKILNQDQKAEEYFQKGIEAGDYSCQFDLASMTLDRKVSSDDLDGLEELIDLKRLETLTDEPNEALGNLYQHIAMYYDFGGEKYADKALYYAKKAFENGADYAINDIARFISEDPDNGNAKAIELFEEDAKSGNAAALTRLGKSYVYGTYGVTDHKKAFSYFKRSLELGDVVSAYYIAKCYEKGIGVDVDEQKAFRILKLIGDCGYSIGLDTLGEYYEKGIGTMPDVDKAFAAYTKALAFGNVGAYGHLGDCYRLGKGCKADPDLAFSYYKKAAYYGYLEGYEGLGICYRDGIGTKVDEKLSQEAFENAEWRRNRFRF